MITDGTGATEATQQSILSDLDAIVLLRRIVKLMESQAAVDVANRQRVTVDAMTSNMTLTNLTTVTTVTTVSTVAAQTSLAGMDREMYINQARVAYSTGIRAKLT
jgi:hypothetical protein